MNQVEGFFSCDVDREEFSAQQAPLETDRTQEWIMVFPAPPDGSSKGLQDLVRVWFASHGEQFGLDLAGLVPTVRDLQVKSTTRSAPPASLPSALKVSSFGPTVASSPLGANKAVVYVGVTFHYTGPLSETPQWPWAARGFQIKCPEDLLGGLYAVLPTTEPPPPPPEGASAIDSILPGLGAGAGDIAKTAKSVTQTVLWAGGAILAIKFYQVVNAGSRRSGYGGA